MISEYFGKTFASITLWKLLLLAFVWIIHVQVLEATTCYKNEAIGNRAGNVYFCNETTKTECCEEESVFTCCETQSRKTLREQLILWGCVGSLVLIITLVCCYFWRDGACGAKDDSSLAQKCCACCCCRSKSQVDDTERLTGHPEPAPGPSRYGRFSPKPWNYGKFVVNDPRDSPPPPFHYKSPSVGKY